MSEIDLHHPEPGKEPPDPTEWHPQDNRDWERAEKGVTSVSMRTEPLNYLSLVDFESGKIAGIEARSKGDLIAVMERRGLQVDERAVRVHWRLVVEGYGFPMPEGFIHPEAPPEIQQQGIAAWKRAVETAGDSLLKFIFVAVWRRRRRLGPSRPPEEVRVLGTGEGIALPPPR